MFGDGEFFDQINRAETLFGQLELLEKREHTPAGDVGAATFRGLSYRKTWEQTYRMFAYDLMLKDQSLIHFTKSGTDEHEGGLSYSYLESPFAVMSYEEFCADYLEINTEADDYEEQMSEFGDLLREDYEKYVNTCDLKPVTPMRYDYAPKDYRSGVHPASHLHFGFENEIRVATKRIMKPLSFALLTVRQRYPKKWLELLAMDDDRVICRSVRTAIDEVHADYWQDDDSHELILE